MSLNYENCFKEARDIFFQMFPDLEFLPQVKLKITVKVERKEYDEDKSEIERGIEELK